MNKLRRFHRSILLLMGITLATNLCDAGNGRFKNGLFDFCVSARFDATPEQLGQIRTVFQNASQVLADATEGQHRFGTVTILNNSSGSDVAEYWISNTVGCAYGTYDQYGVRGQHVVLFFRSDFQGLSGSAGDAYTIAHEHSHHAYGLGDEYSGPFRPGCVMVPMRQDCVAECSPPPLSDDTGALKFCLMDNFFTRGGRMGDGQSVSATYTLNEFCVASNHDMANTSGMGAGNTYQQSINSNSCWETISSHPKRGATAPANLPVDTPPTLHTVTFRDGFAGLRVVLVLDRSGSMLEDDRLGYAKLAGSQFVRFLADGDSVGVISFSGLGDVTTDFPLTTITGGATRNVAQTAINALSAAGSTGTDIADALLSARGKLAAQVPRSCNEIIVLLTDGDQTIGTPITNALAALQDDGITVFTAGVGTRISSAGQATLQDIASQTGGRYLRVANSFDLVGLFFRLVFQSLEHALVERQPLAITTAQTNEVKVLVEPGVVSTTFTVSIADANDVFTMSLQTPTGRVITESSIAGDAQFIPGPNSKAFKVQGPEAGLWTIILAAGTIQTGTLELQTFADHQGVQLNVGVAKGILNYPDEAKIQATPTFEGMNVIQARVSGVIKRPDDSVVPIQMFDDGAFEHADAVAGDGIYSARFSNYNIEGTYEINLTVEATNSMTYAGEALFESVGNAQNTRQLPTFNRVGLASLFVRKAPTVIHDYELNGSFADRLGGPAMASGGGNLQVSGYRFGFGEGLNLSGALFRPDNYAIEMYFSINDVLGLRKLIDFKDLASQNGLYNQDGALSFYTNAVTSPTNGLAGALAPEGMTHLVITRDGATGQLVIFINGVQQIAFNDSTGEGVFNSPSHIIHLFQSDVFFDNDPSGFVDFVHIYDKPLSQSEVFALYSAVVAPAITIRCVSSCIATSNLLVNPGAEIGDLTGWTVQGVSQPFVGSPTNGFDRFPAHSGNFYFAGGTGSYGGFTQRIPVVGKQGLTSEMIDTGRLLISIGFWEIGSNQPPTSLGPTIDVGRIAVACRDDNTNVLKIVRFPDIDAYTRAWSNYQGSASLPIGTRFLDYTMEFLRETGGTIINVGIDDNSLTISGESATNNVVGNVPAVAISWPSEENRIYQVQRSVGLATNSWINLGAPLFGNGNTSSYCDRIVGQAGGFYRVLVVK